MAAAAGVVESVVLDKQTTGLGFTIRGGSDEEIEGNSEQGIFVTSIKSNGAAARSGRINIGDRILQIDGHVLDSVTHAEAVNLFHQTGDIVTLLIEKKSSSERSQAHLRRRLSHFRNKSLWLPVTIVIIIFGLPTAYFLYRKLR